MLKSKKVIKNDKMMNSPKIAEVSNKEKTNLYKELNAISFRTSLVRLSSFYRVEEEKIFRRK
jgi:phage regulator Rha-like protein